jgi:hypothetical protein
MTDVNIAANSVAEFDVEEARQSADEMARAFELAGDRIASALQSAAKRGEFSFAQMAEQVSRDLARIAVQELVTAPLEGVFNSLISSVTSQAVSAKAAPVNVTMKLSGSGLSAETVQKSEGQIAAGLARALNQGRKLT